MGKMSGAKIQAALEIEISRLCQALEKEKMLRHTVELSFRLQNQGLENSREGYEMIQIELEKEKKKNSMLLEAMNMAWAIIANAGGGDWQKEDAQWQKAAAHWRDNYYHKALSAGEPGGGNG